MPDEHSGVVRDNYQWKVLIQRSTNSEEEFTSVTNGEFDQDLFLLSWGPTIAALSYVYDHADDKTIAQKAITGFRYVPVTYVRTYVTGSVEIQFSTG